MSSSRDKIILINDAPIFSGVGRYANDISLSLGSGGITISFVMDSKYINSEFPGEKYKGIFPPFTKGGWSLNNTFRNIIFRKQISNIKKKLQDSRSLIHYSNPLIKPIRESTEDVVTIHDLFFYNDRVSTDTVAHKTLVKNINIYKTFHNILTVSNTMQKVLMESGFSGKITTIYPPVSNYFKIIPEKISLRKKLNLPVDKKLVLSVSTTAKRKNIPTVKKTMELLGDEYMLIRVGEDIGTGVSFQNISPDSINDVYNACDVLLFPSLGEGFGYPLVEAMKTGLPVVASDIDVMREISDNAAVLVAPTPESCAEGIKEALNNSDKYIESGIRRSQIFSFDIFRDNILKYYSRIK